MVFDLLKLAYRACSFNERGGFDNLSTMRVDLQECCMLLIGRSQNANGGGNEARYQSNVPMYMMPFVCVEAARHGHVDCLRIARLKGHEWNAQTCEAAAFSGHLDALRYLREGGCAWDRRVPAAAASGGHLEILSYALQNGCPATVSTCWSAAAMGNLECLRYAHGVHSCPVDDSVMDAAVLFGRLDCLRYLRAIGRPWSWKTGMYAATRGQLAVLKYAHRHGCPRDRWTTTAAACSGQLDVLKYAVRHGLGWDVYTFRAAVAGGHDECVDYLRAAGCPRDQWPDIVNEVDGTVRSRRQIQCPFELIECAANIMIRDHMMCLEAYITMFHREQ